MFADNYWLLIMHGSMGVQNGYDQRTETGSTADSRRVFG